MTAPDPLPDIPVEPLTDEQAEERTIGLTLEESKAITRAGADRRRVAFARDMPIGQDPDGEPYIMQVQGVAEERDVPPEDILHRKPNRAEIRRHQKQLREQQAVRKRQELRKSKSRKSRGR